METKTGGPKTLVSEDLTQGGTSNMGSLYPLCPLLAARKVEQG